MTHEEIAAVQIKLRDIREELGVHISHVARRLGIDERTLRNWEATERHLNLAKLSDWAKELGFTLKITLEEDER